MNDDLQTTNNESKSMTGAWIWLVLSVLYTVSPIDILPDVVPVAGWMDDVLILGSGILNMLQAEFGKTNETLSHILGVVKWGVIILGVIAIALIGILGGLIFKLVS